MLIAYTGYPAADCFNFCLRQAALATRMALHEGKRIRKLRTLKKYRGPLTERLPDLRLHISGERYVLH